MSVWQLEDGVWRRRRRRLRGLGGMWGARRERWRRWRPFREPAWHSQRPPETSRLFMAGSWNASRRTGKFGPGWRGHDDHDDDDAHGPGPAKLAHPRLVPRCLKGRVRAWKERHEQSVRAALAAQGSAQARAAALVRAAALLVVLLHRMPDLGDDTKQAIVSLAFGALVGRSAPTAGEFETIGALAQGGVKGDHEFGLSYREWEYRTLPSWEVAATLLHHNHADDDYRRKIKRARANRYGAGARVWMGEAPVAHTDFYGVVSNLAEDDPSMWDELDNDRAMATMQCVAFIKSCRFTLNNGRGQRWRFGPHVTVLFRGASVHRYNDWMTGGGTKQLEVEIAFGRRPPRICETPPPSPLSVAVSGRISPGNANGGWDKGGYGASIRAHDFRC